MRNSAVACLTLKWNQTWFLFFILGSFKPNIVLWSYQNIPKIYYSLLLGAFKFNKICSHAVTRVLSLLFSDINMYKLIHMKKPNLWILFVTDCSEVIKFFSSPEVKAAQVSFSHHFLSGFGLSFCLPVNFLHFQLLLQNHWASFNQTCQNHHWMKGIQICSNEGPHSLLRGDNFKILEICWYFKKKTSS